jgi:Uma2 family endonuclease
MAVQQRMSEAAYEQFMLSGADGAWELHDGRLVEKPGMTWDHLDVVARLGKILLNALDEGLYRVFFESRVRRPEATIFLPDLMVVPTSYGEPFRGRPGKLAIFDDPLPLVVEGWSASTGDYDVDAKLPVYQQRGDLEIWRIHPYERTLTAWHRQPDGGYAETLHREGLVRPMALPGVEIDLAALCDKGDQ